MGKELFVLQSYLDNLDAIPIVLSNKGEMDKSVEMSKIHLNCLN